ncbi:MAG: S16 family serine protease, partial [Desulfocucumaceae bacterium]
LAAHRAGIKIIILPQDNRKDLDEIPVNVKKNLQFKLVDHMDEVLDIALIKEESEPDAVLGTDAVVVLPEVVDYNNIIQTEGGPRIHS